MTSIHTNTSAMIALQSLASINGELDKTQERISTGYRVNSASDNAAYWSIATTMRSDNQALGAVKDTLGLGQAKVDVAYTGLQSAIKVVDQIKTKLTASSEPGVDRTKVNAEIKELQGQLKSIAESASFSGENWLSIATGETAGTKKVVSSFNRTDAGVSLGSIDIDGTKIKLFDTDNADGILDGGTQTNGTVIASFSIDNTTTDAALGNMMSDVEEALTSMTTAASNLGSAKTRMDIQKEFVTDLRAAIDRGIGTLVDANMSEESTKLKALQTQQQLGIQALSIANSSSQNVLSLFR